MKTTLARICKISVALTLLGLTTIVPPVCASGTCGTQVSCLETPVDTVTSELEVSHYGLDGEVYVIPVEPDTGETWSITAYWRTTELLSVPAFCRCTEELSETVTVDVDFSSGWQASCTGCGSMELIRDVDICTGASCGEGDDVDQSWSYELIADIQKQNGFYICEWELPPPYGTQRVAVARNLARVVYTTTSVDDGDEVDSQACTEGVSVSPTSQTWSATDNGAFECPFDCDATGATVSILYD